LVMKKESNSSSRNFEGGVRCVASTVWAARGNDWS
jgi:hypothetical protein